MTRYIEPNLSDKAHEYFGGDVQRYWIERDDGPGYQCYRLWQQPHRGNAREVAVVVAATAKEARTAFNEMARDAERAHC